MAYFSWAADCGGGGRRGGRGTSRKIGWGCATHFPKPLPYLWPKSTFFATLFMTCPKIRNPIYDCCGWHSCPKHKLWRSFFDGFIDKDEKVASSEKHTQFKTRVLKPYPIYNQNGQNRYPIYDQNCWKTLPFGAALTYTAHTREYPLPRDSKPQGPPVENSPVPYTINLIRLRNDVMTLQLRLAGRKDTPCWAESQWFWSSEQWHDTFAR